MRAGVVLMAMAGCGRVSFDPVSTAFVPADGDAADAMGAPNIMRVMTSNPAFVSTASITAPLDNAQPGHLLVAIPYWNNATHTVTVADSSGLTWTALPRASVPTGCNGNVGANIQIFYAPVTVGGATMVTATQSVASDPLGLIVVQYSGVTTLDTSSSLAAPSASNAITAGTLATTGYDLIVAGFHDSSGSGQMSPGAGLMPFQLDLVSYAMFGDMQVPAGSHAITGTLPSGRSDACWVGAAAAFHAH